MKNIMVIPMKEKKRSMDHQLFLNKKKVYTTDLSQDIKIILSTIVVLH